MVQTVLLGLIACKLWRPEIAAAFTTPHNITANELAEELQTMKNTQDLLMLKLGDKIRPESSAACKLANKAKLSAQREESDAAIAALKAMVASLRNTIESQGAERARLQAWLASKSSSSALVATGASLGMEVGALRHQAGRVGKQLLHDCTAPIKSAAAAVAEGCSAVGRGTKATALKAKTTASAAKNATKLAAIKTTAAAKNAAAKTARAPHHVAAAAARRVALAAEATAKGAAQVASACSDGKCHNDK